MVFARPAFAVSRAKRPGSDAHHSQYSAGHKDSAAYIAFSHRVGAQRFPRRGAWLRLEVRCRHELVRALNVLAGDGTYVSPGVDQSPALKAIIEESHAPN
jgi:hypothetical protein